VTQQLLVWNDQGQPACAGCRQPLLCGRLGAVINHDEYCPEIIRLQAPAVSRVLDDYREGLIG
jgi:hypothetical protein